MVVSMDRAGTVSEVEDAGEGFTAIVPSNTAMQSTEADTTFTRKQSLCNDKSKTTADASAKCEQTPDLLSKQLKEFISLQLDLIEYQQAKITSKDKQIVMLRNEKEQLEARICRMERRLALQKKQVEPDENQVSKTKVVQQTRNLTPPVHTPSGVKNEAQLCKQQLPVTVTSRNDREFRFNTYLRTNVNYLNLPHSKLLQDVVEPKEFPVKEVRQIQTVSVPQWKLVESKQTCMKDSVEEDVTNDAFCKRHNKPELEEKRRKRWDLQHLRQQQQQQHLTEKCKSNKIGNDKGKNATRSSNINVFTSLFPKAENMMAIEISNVVPVCVFGYPAPAVNTKELELPWFSIAKREVQLRQAKEKEMKKSAFKKGFLAKKHSSKKKKCD